MQDKLNAQEYLQNLQMHPRETISSFISRFHRAIQHIYDASSNPEPLPEIYLINLFLVKTLHAVPASSDIRSTLLDYQRLIQRARNLNDIPFTLADIEYEVSTQENNTKSATSRTITSRRETANAINTTNNQSRKRKQIRCFHCGGNHRLQDCRKCSKEEKQRLWEKHGPKSRKRTSQSKPSSAHQASVASNSTQKPSTQSQTQKKNDKDNCQAHAVVTVPSSFRPKVSFASMAKVLTTLPQQHAFPVTHHNKMEQTSLLSQWLIDSGCSTHMTPFVEDLVKDHESTSAAVEVANGNIIQATTIGTVSIRVVDIKTKKVYNIYLQISFVCSWIK